jgi:iron complex transport system substrate-binding protein
MLFVIGAGEQVVAADEYSDYPNGAPTTDLSGFTPNVEAVAAYRPDLVVIQGDANDLVASLGALQIPVLVMPAAASLDDVYTQIEALGAATGHDDEAADVVANIQDEVAGIIASVPERATPLTYYHELDPNLFSATSSTFIGSVYGLLGLENIADPADEDGFGYPQLSAEFIISADPDLIFLADTKCCAQKVATVAERPGWSELSAVKNGGVVELDDDIASRGGPRIVDYLRVVADKVAGLVTAG